MFDAELCQVVKRNLTNSPLLGNSRASVSNMFDGGLCQIVKRNLTNSPHSAIAERVLGGLCPKSCHNSNTPIKKLDRLFQALSSTTYFLSAT